ncbi:hypothetical protein MKW94_022351 [Papaver nudicaule]|uniref:Uncharacterized protein n=1 Tax=Papaver nudicaule TaxID=74823 RepID=A0AA41SQX9_PAPNU|nr:hypothetical protein [Papaver nudicaule]
MAVFQEEMAPISPLKRRKLSIEESGPCETKAVCINEPEHLPPLISSDSPAIPVLLVQEFVTEENVDDLPLSNVKRSRGKFPTGTSLDNLKVQSEKVLESVAGMLGNLLITSSSANCLTFIDSMSP